MCVCVCGGGAESAERSGKEATHHKTPQQLHYFLTGFGPIMTTTEIMCVDRSLLFWKYYSICVAANLSVAPRRSSYAAVHSAGMANRDRRLAKYTTAGMNETEKAHGAEGTAGGVQKLHVKRAQALKFSVHTAEQNPHYPRAERKETGIFTKWILVAR